MFSENFSSIGSVLIENFPEEEEEEEKEEKKQTLVMKT
jgi:hypothetical protein